MNGLVAACLIGTASAACATERSVHARDQHFVRKFSMIRLEVERIGQLAQTRSQDAQVKDLGQKLIEAYAQADQQLAVTAQAVDVNATKKIGGRAARKLNKLADLSGAAFDKAALHELFKCEETGISQLDREASGNGNEALRRSAAQVQTTIEPVVWRTAQLNAQFNSKS